LDPGWTSYGQRQRNISRTESTRLARTAVEQLRTRQGRKLTARTEQQQQGSTASSVRPLPSARQSSASDRHDSGLTRLKRHRMWACLVAVDIAGGADEHSSSRPSAQPERQAPQQLLQPSRRLQQTSPSEQTSTRCGARPVVLGYVIVCVSQPLAALPPPWPSAAPWQVRGAVRLEGANGEAGA
jgi:hypothetical protein